MPSLPPVLAYILKGYPRISETFISNEILLLEQLGFTMRIFSMRRPRETFSHPSVKQINATVSYLPTELSEDFLRLILPNIFLAIKAPGPYRRALALAKERYDRNASLATLKHLLQAGYMTNTFLRREANIVHLHGHFAHSPTSVTMFAALLTGLPFSFTAHAKDIYTSSPAQLRQKIAKATFVATCTQHNATYLNDIASDCPTPIHCVYHGIDLNLFQNSACRITPGHPYRLLTIARLTEKKGLPTVYRALAILKRQGVPFHHVLIGDGDDRDLIRQLITDLDLDGECQWLGTRTHDEVLKQFRNSDLFVLGCEIAGNGDRDGIPNVLVESLAMGVPALSTRVSAIPEILRHGQTGYTVAPSDPAAMAEAILLLLQDQQLRRTLITSGKAWVAAHFDNSQLLSELASIFIKANPLLRVDPQHN